MDAWMPRVIFNLIFALLVWWLHRGVGKYPPSLLGSADRKREMWEVAILYGIALSFSTFDRLYFTPWLQASIPGPKLQELVRVPVLSLIYAVLPIIWVMRVNGWEWKDLGFTFRSKSKDVSIFALTLGAVTGLVAFLSGKSNLGLQALPPGVLILLFYNNAILEELFYRGVLQAKLERGIGQQAAIVWGGILFGLKHLALDTTALSESSGCLAVLLALMLQTLSGWLLGMTYMKTRSLWPGIICHYLGNWLPSFMLYSQVVFLK